MHNAADPLPPALASLLALIFSEYQPCSDLMHLKHNDNNDGAPSCIFWITSEQQSHHRYQAKDVKKKKPGC
jgi:hypothetical protein